MRLQPGDIHRTAVTRRYLMPLHDTSDDEPPRLRAAIRLVMRRYLRRVRARPWLAITSLVLPGVGNIFVFFVPPLAIAHLLGLLAHNPQAGVGELVNPVILLAVAWLGGEAIWRLVGLALSRLECHAIGKLYIEAMDDLFAKDAGFFHNNFAGSLTKRVLGYARRFEDVADVFAFSICGNLLPLVFALVVLARFSGWLLVVLVAMLAIAFVCMRPLIRRRHQLVLVREEASTALAGHVADSITNAETVRAFAREREEAAIHARNVSDSMAKMLRSWHYQNTRVDIVTSPLYVLTNTLGLIVALAVGRGSGFAIEAVFLTFSYFAQTTRVMWEFNRMYRNLESALTDAAQFTELLLDPPAIVDADPVERFQPRDASVRFRAVRFAHPSRPALFDGLDLMIRRKDRMAVMGVNGAGKSTLLKLVAGASTPDGGTVNLGASVKVGYFAQHAMEVLEPGKTVWQILEESFPLANIGSLRTLAGCFGFSGDDIDKTCRVLSGGEKARLVLARLMYDRPNFLVLDEPTNHLDVATKDMVVRALADFEGTMLFVSHDRQFLAKLSNRILELTPEGTHLYGNGYLEYVARSSHEAPGVGGARPV